ncbi:hypothetical protein [Lactococcus lactis]|uniref:hypothetical protein n=1 Tax=Lactococcus lactis TaxID=1358 RepID=UPI00288DA08A|nr:hypothetical protein [Lactococcus lactis]MDT2857846.1 hypothetical protein [Lactococcus lactis]
MSTSIISYSEIVEVIKAINVLHKKFSSELGDILTYKLSKSVRNVVDEQGITIDFQKLINEYKTALTLNTVRVFEIQNRFPNVRSRAKQGESVREKLIYYRKTRENGGIPINKCLNDFLGFRLIVSDLSTIQEKLELDDEVQGIISKMYSRSDGLYQGLHLYFKNHNNKFFPWELQLWDVNHAKQNELSHKEHKEKRKYILVPQNYHDGNLEKEE